MFLALWGLLLPAASRAQSTAERDELLRRFEAAIDLRDWKKVVELGERLDRMPPQSSVVAFEIACAYGQLGEAGRSLDWLQRAADRGYQGITRLEADPSLDSVRTLPGFAAVRGTIAARRKEGFERFRRAADSETPLLVWPDGQPGEVKMILVALHGAGGTGKEMAEAWKQVASQYRALLIAPDALRPVGNGYSWVFLDEGEWYVLETVRRAREQWHLPDEPVILAGYSQGANLALRVGVLHPGAFRGIIAINGHYEAYLMPAPADVQVSPHFYLLAGEEDPAVATLRDAASAFKKAGLRVKLQTFRGGHQMPQPAAPALRRAMDFVLSEK